LPAPLLIVIASNCDPDRRRGDGGDVESQQRAGEQPRCVGRQQPDQRPPDAREPDGQPVAPAERLERQRQWRQRDQQCERRTEPPERRG